MSLRRRLKHSKPPAGWELVEDVVEDFEQQMRDAVNEEHEGKRRNETNWKIHRIHWEKNRFFYDLMYVRKVMSRELYDWLVREKIADGALIAKWRKPGYEILCSMLAIQRNNHNFGTTSHCRVPMRQRAAQQRITPDVQTGCICCASGDGKFGGPIWWNTPLDDDSAETAEQNRAVWSQAPEAHVVPESTDGPNQAPLPHVDDPESADAAPVPAAVVGQKRAAPLPLEDEDELDDDVKRRLAALRGDG